MKELFEKNEIEIFIHLEDGNIAPCDFLEWDIDGETEFLYVLVRKERIWTSMDDIYIKPKFQDDS